MYVDLFCRLYTPLLIQTAFYDSFFFFFFFRADFQARVLWLLIPTVHGNASFLNSLSEAMVTNQVHNSLSHNRNSL